MTSGSTASHGVIGVPAAPRELDALSAAILQQPGMAPVSLPGGVSAWAAGHHRTLRELLADPRFNRDWRQWRALQDGEIPEDHPLVGMCRLDNMVTAHGPDHRRLRGLLSRSFLPGRIALLKPRIGQCVDRLLANIVQGGGRADLMDAFAIPLPTNVIAELFGLPDEEREEIVALTHSLASTSAPAEEVRQTRQRIPEFFHRLIARKRRQPGGDLASALIAGRDRGELVSDTELVDMLFMVLSAGFVTTAGVIGNGVLALLAHPRQLELLRSGQVPWTQAIEEILRWGSSVSHLPFRYATRDMDFGGCPVRRGDAVLMAFHAANRDEQVFGPGAHGFDITRQHNPHLSFGHGPHFCLGAALARLELHCAFPALFSALDELALAVPEEDIAYMPSYVIRCPQHLPVTFRPSSHGK